MKITKIIPILALVAGSLYSCYEDESALSYKLVNPISIDMGGAKSEFVVFAYDTLEIKPLVYKDGVNDKNLSFRWTVSGNSVPPTILDSTMTLKAMVDLQPNSVPYNLLYEVKDNTTGIVQEQTFTIRVESPFGSGLVVSETVDDKTSDVSLIRAYNFSYGLKKDQDTIMRNLFSLVNKRKINGVGTAILSTKYGVYGRFMTIGTNSSIDRVDPFDYSYIDGNGSTFIIDPKDYNVTSLGFSKSAGCIETVVIGGKLYTHYYQNKNLHTYSYYLLTNDMSDYRLSLSTQPEWAYGLCFDELNGRLLEIQGDQCLRVINSKKIAADAPFDPNKLQDFTCRAMFSGKNMIGHNILQEKDPVTGKAKEGGKIYCYDTYQNYYYDDMWGANPDDPKNGKPYRIIDFNGFEDIQKALFFTGTNNRDYIYYATPTKIYTINLTLKTATVDYVVPTTESDDEVITSMSVWLGDGKMEYTDNRGEERSTGSNNNMLVITTYSPSLKEGFVRTLPISIFTGHIESNKDYHNMWRGFGKITASTTQTTF